MASGELFPVTPPAPVARAGWQCPGCLTHYSPDVQYCRCAADERWLADRLKPQPPVFPGGGTIGFPPDANCTCPPAWGGICPPPACPAHGPSLTTRIIC